MTSVVSALSFVESASEDFYTNGVMNKSLLGTDGFIPVTRRLMYTLYTMAQGEYKTPELVARTLRVHPHGESSVESALGSMAHPWRYPLLPIEFIGNAGTLVTPMAAPRYTSVSGNCYVGKFVRKLLPFVDRFVGESHDEEVDYMPMPYPVLLTSGFNQAVGTGISSQFINHSFESVMALAYEMVNTAEGEKTLGTKFKNKLKPYYYGSGEMQSGLGLHDSRGTATYEADYEVVKAGGNKYNFIMRSSLGRIASEKVYAILQEKYDKTFLGHMNQTNSNGLQVEITFVAGKELRYDDIVNLLVNRLKLRRTLNVKQVALRREIGSEPGTAMPEEVTQYQIMSDWLLNTYDLIKKSILHDLEVVRQHTFDTRLKLFVVRNTEEVVQQNKTGDYGTVAKHMGVSNEEIAPLVQNIRFGALNEKKLLEAQKELIAQEAALNEKLALGIRNILPILDANMVEFNNA